MRRYRRFVTILALIVVTATAADAQKGRRPPEEKPTESEPAAESSAVETVKAVYDAAVSFVTAVAMEVAKQLPVDMSSNPEQVRAWEAQTHALEELRDQIDRQARALKAVFDDSDGKETVSIAAVRSITAMRVALQSAIQRENQIISPRDPASGFGRLFSERRDTITKLRVDLDMAANVALQRLGR